MAKNAQPVAKRCKALGIAPSAMGYDKKITNRNPKGQMRRKQSEYAIQLNEKQKVKFVYGMLEKQFRSYYERAEKMPGKSGDNLLILCERRRFRADPPSGPSAGEPRPLHCGRSQGKHSVLSGKTRRGDRCCAEEPLFRTLHQAHRRRCAFRYRTRMTEPREKRAQGHRSQNA